MDTDLFSIFFFHTLADGDENRKKKGSELVLSYLAHAENLSDKMERVAKGLPLEAVDLIEKSKDAKEVDDEEEGVELTEQPKQVYKS
jgi:hypothetical protein